MVFKYQNYVSLRGLGKDQWEKWDIIRMVFGKSEELRRVFEENNIEFTPDNIKIFREEFSKHLAVLLSRENCICGIDKEGRAKHPLILETFLGCEIEIPSNCPTIDFDKILSPVLPTFSTIKNSQPSIYWDDLLDYFLEEINKADLGHKLVEYDIGSTPEIWQDRITRWFKFYFERKDYYEIDEEHGDNSSKTYISRVRKLLDIGELNRVKERFSEKYVTKQLLEAVKTKSPQDFSSYSFLQGSCTTHRVADMPSDLCIHYQDQHLMSINIKFTLKSPDKFLAATPEINFRPAALLLLNVDYSKRKRGAYLALKLLAKEEQGERLKKMPIITGKGKERWEKIAEEIIKIANSKEKGK